MPFKYYPLKFANENMAREDKNEILQYNRNILRSGVVDKACLDAREPTRGERLDYEQFAPHGTMLSWVEVYENGGMNIFVRSKLYVGIIGVIIVRPWEEPTQAAIDAQFDRMTGGNVE